MLKMFSLHNGIQINDILQKTNLDFLGSSEIKKSYGSSNLDIDYLINVNDMILCIKEKYDRVTPYLSNIKDFITSVNSISNKTNKECIGIYVSCMPLANESKKILETQNSISNSFYSINDLNRHILLQKLINILYANNIFMYNEDDSCIMINN